MFEILLDENSDKEKREKVRTALDLGKWLFDVRGCTREQNPAFPSPPPLDGGKELGGELHSERRSHLCKGEDGPISQNTKCEISLDFCSGPSLAPSRCCLQAVTHSCWAEQS